MKQVPFLSNTPDGMHCVQAAFGMMLKNFLPESSYDFASLDALTHRVGDQGTWTFPGLVELSRLGLEVSCVEKFEYERFFDEGESYVREAYQPEVAEWYLTHSNLMDVRALVPEFLQTVRHEQRTANIDEIRKLVCDGWLVGLEINPRVLRGEDGIGFHMVVVFDTEGESFFLHDPGLPPLPNRKVDTSLLLKAWESSGSENKAYIAVRQKTAA